MVSLRNRRLGGDSSRNGRAHFTVACISMGRSGYRGWYSDSLRTVRFGVRTPVVQRDFLSLVPVNTGPGANLASCILGIGAVYAGGSGWGVVLTTHCHLAPRLRISRSVPLLHLPEETFTFMYVLLSLMPFIFCWRTHGVANEYEQILSAVTI